MCAQAWPDTVSAHEKANIILFSAPKSRSVLLVKGVIQGPAGRKYNLKNLEIVDWTGWTRLHWAKTMLAWPCEESSVSN